VTNYESSYTWENEKIAVPENIIKGVAEMGWRKPSKVQSQSIFNISSNKQEHMAF
jgi:hypothetical protein